MFVWKAWPAPSLVALVFQGCISPVLLPRIETLLFKVSTWNRLPPLALCTWNAVVLIGLVLEVVGETTMPFSEIVPSR
jgi:hypothetical protein